MAICRKCKKEYMDINEAQEYCPACRQNEPEIRAGNIQNTHLKEKQKRFTSE